MLLTLYKFIHLLVGKSYYGIVVQVVLVPRVTIFFPLLKFASVWCCEFLFFYFSLLLRVLRITNFLHLCLLIHFYLKMFSRPEVLRESPGHAKGEVVIAGSTFNVIATSRNGSCFFFAPLLSTLAMEQCLLVMSVYLGSCVKTWCPLLPSISMNTAFLRTTIRERLYLLLRPTLRKRV